MLHRLIYVSAIAGAVHYYWLVKSDETVPLRFAAVVAILLGYRLVSTAAIAEAAEAALPSGTPRRQSSSPCCPLDRLQIL